MLHPSLSQSNRRRSRYQQNVQPSLMHRPVLIHWQHQYLEEIRWIENPSNYIITGVPTRLATRNLRPGEPTMPTLGAASQNQSTVTAAGIRVAAKSAPLFKLVNEEGEHENAMCNLHNLIDPLSVP